MEAARESELHVDDVRNQKSAGEMEKDTKFVKIHRRDHL